MKKSLFAKYFTVCISIIIVSIIFLGGMMLICASQYFQEEQYNTLKVNLQRATMAVEQNYINAVEDDNDQTHYTIDVASSLSIYNMLAGIIDADFFMTDTSGKTIMCTEDTLCQHTSPYTVPSEIRGMIDQKGIYKETGTFQGLYSSNHYTVGIPVQNDDVTIGYLFASSSSSNLQVFLKEIFNMFILSSGVVLFLAFVIIFLVTSQLVKPLKDMSYAAQQYGKGDFSPRISIERDDEIGQLAQTLNTMAYDLSLIENSRRSFTANVSHELKTPMTSIGGFIDGILDGTIPESQHKKYLRIVSDEVARLSRLVRSMLNLSKIEAGEMKLECKPFNALNVIAQTLFNFENAINEKNLEIRGLDVDDIWVEADEDLIHQVIYNLMDNAIKFVNQNGYIEFGFRNIASRTEITIRNSGEGLAPDEMNKVFDRFYKTDKSRGLDKNGVGLGLNIVKTIINLHDGDIVVRSKKGEYTEFSITLKTGKPPVKPRRSPDKEQP